MNIKLFSYILLAVLMLVSPVFAQNPDNSDPDSIDPYDPSSLDFLAPAEEPDESYVDTAWGYYLDEDYELAATYYLAWLNLHPDHYWEIYNLACCYGLLGEAELAADSLKYAYEGGWEDIEWAGEDTDFELVRDDPYFMEIFESIENDIADQDTHLGQYVFSAGPTMHQSQVILPVDYDEDEEYILLVGLHGLGSNLEFWETLYGRFDDPDFIYASPQAPYLFDVTDHIGWSWTWFWETPEIADYSYQQSSEYIMSIVEGMKSSHNISEVYLLGFSQGCMMAVSTSINHADEIDGFIAFGGWLEEGWVSEEHLIHGSGLRCFIAHGNEDFSVPFEDGVKCAEILEGYGYDVTFYEFDDGHRVPEEVLQAAETWMKE